MKRILMLGLVAALSSLMAARADEPDPEPFSPDRAALMRGNWEMTALVIGGMKLAGNAGLQNLKMTMKFERNGLTETTNGMAKKGTWKIDARKKPKTIDLTDKTDGKTTVGIYKLEKDELTIALAEPGKARPTDFKGTAMILKRIKK
jgi:uncharacterized protein (TIGR03067 family)